MSAFVTLIFDNEIIIAADTLVTIRGEQSHVPLNFISKIHPLPSKHSVIIGIGSYQVIRKWYEIANSNIVARNIETLDEQSVMHMKQLLKEFNQEYACIYQIGFDSKNKIHAYKYDLGDEFKREVINSPFFCRPGLDIDLGEFLKNLTNRILDKEEKDNNHAYSCIADECYKLLCRLKELDSEETKDGSSSIGGHMEFFIMNKNGYTLKQLRPFANYENDYQICESRNS